MKKIALFLGCLLLTTWAQAEDTEQEKQFRQGIELLDSKQYEQAEQVFNQLVEKFPEQIIYLNNLAVAQMAQGKTEQALENLNTAIETDQVYSVSQKNLSQVYAFMASQAYAKALDKTEALQYPELKPIINSPHKHVETINEVATEPLKAEQVKAEQVKAEQVKAEQVTTEIAENNNASLETEPPVAGIEGETKLVTELSLAENQIEKAPATASQFETQLKNKLAAWAESWMHGKVDTYLAFYSPAFIPSDKLSYNDWLAQRRYRLRHSNQVQVSYNQVEVYFDSNLESAMVEFVQHYSAGNYQDVVKKQLYWQLKDNNWLITREQVTEKN